MIVSVVWYYNMLIMDLDLCAEDEDEVQTVSMLQHAHDCHGCKRFHFPDRFYFLYALISQLVL